MPLSDCLVVLCVNFGYKMHSIILKVISYLLTLIKIKCIETIHSLQCCHGPSMERFSLSAYVFKLAGVPCGFWGIST